MRGKLIVGKIMRYIEFMDGEVILAPQNFFSHKELLSFTGRLRSDVRSAGFLGSRYNEDEAWKPYGKSTGLGIPSQPDVMIPSKLYTRTLGKSVVFYSSPSLVESPEAPLLAKWGMSEPGYWGDIVPVYVPVNPEMRLTAEEIMGH